MCKVNYSNSVRPRQFRIDRVVAKRENPRFPSTITYFLQMRFNRKDVWITVKAFCCADPEDAKRQAEELLAHLNASVVTRNSGQVTASEEPVEIPEVKEATIVLPANITYKEMKAIIMEKKLPIKKNLSYALMKEQLTKALNG